ncbi:hypothetical protein BC939DRAFT_473027 [Gamsiella multidivaricata]|uniref:uncharacterized protein n=1 Tax=Gamsiella multidivaricata TaxID=101098 RepID=UPI002220A7C3|nr:uncharacterized protein BC939DRAFT_473027 [Gamsiella multidivaricata]KAI7831457.1 hypothetical protein BC939DRAFT_473027 [Gamsiella multidivaricata]
MDSADDGEQGLQWLRPCSSLGSPKSSGLSNAFAVPTHKDQTGAQVVVMQNILEFTTHYVANGKQLVPFVTDDSHRYSEVVFKQPVRSSAAEVVSVDSRPLQFVRALPFRGSLDASESIGILARFDNATGEWIVLWMDILLIFKNAHYSMEGSVLVPFLTDCNLEMHIDNYIVEADRHAKYRASRDLWIPAYTSSTMELVGSIQEDSNTNLALRSTLS